MAPMRALAIGLCLAAAAAAQQPENLSYSINWPSGLSLGEGSITAVRSGHHWDLSLKLEATIPGFPLRDEYHARASDGLCSVTFEKQSTHGSRIASEKSTFDAERKIVRRETSKGGSSETPIANCAKDALSFLFFVRKELAQGRIPPAQTIFFGAPYQASLKSSGAEQVKLGDQRVEADRLSVTLKGPASETTFDISFARDPARTPLVIRSQFAMGSFSMELVP
jgi:hypothetical protein